MTKLLKLTGIQTYTGTLTRTGEGNLCAKVVKGDVIAMTDADAASALTGSNTDREGRPVPYFTDVTGQYDGPLTHDLTERARKSAQVERAHTAKEVMQPDGAKAISASVSEPATGLKPAAGPVAKRATQRGARASSAT